MGGCFILIMGWFSLSGDLAAETSTKWMTWLLLRSFEVVEFLLG
jgi:hypothetical protein